MVRYHTIVIGAGPAGLLAAGEIGKRNKKVLLLEKNKTAGKKLLISGSGQCNFTHDGEMAHFFEKYGEHHKFLKKAFSLYTNKDTMQFFTGYGVGFEIRENGKVFPITHKSQTILDALLLHCKKHNVQISYEKAVSGISVYDGVYTVETEDGGRYFSNHVVIATGGKSYPTTGSTGDGYSLAESLGHTIVEPKPALTYVTTQEKAFAEVSGIAYPEAFMSVWRDNKKLLERTGSVLFTHKGLSGPLILDSTRWIQAGDKIELNMMYPKTYEEVRKQFAQDIPPRGKQQIMTYLTKEQGIIKSVATVVCRLAGVEEDKVCARMSKEEREKLVTLLTKCPFNISGLGGYHIAMVTAGGIALKQVNPTTMESRKHQGLYFVGEVLDIDGDTGGYNIQAAFSMAYLCAKHLAEK
ncbi:MAG: NAD(P)/FAD-dependent oxidoreductase [Cellulosilyticaceae bacterium]